MSKQSIPQVTPDDPTDFADTAPAWMDAAAWTAEDVAGAAPPAALVQPVSPHELLDKFSANGHSSSHATQETAGAAPDAEEDGAEAARAATVAATVSAISALVADVPKNNVHDGKYYHLLPALRSLVSTLREDERTWENVGQYLSRIVLKQRDRDGFLESCTLPADTSASETDAALSYWTPRAYTVGAFLDRPPKQWLVDKVLGVQDFALLYGESGHGKTHAGLDFAYSCATGAVTFADTFTIARPLTVAYATGEGLGGLADRLRAVSGYYGAVDVPLYLFADIPQLFTYTDDNGARQFARAWQAMAEAGTVPAQLDVLILDTLHNATAGSDENSAKDAAIVQKAMRELRDTLGCAVLLVHHANKSGTSERGSSALRASCDTVLRAQKVGRSYTLSCEKLKDAETWPALSFDLVSVNGCTSVRVFWQGQAQTAAQTGRSKLEAQVMAHLDSHSGRRYTADEVAQAIKQEDARTAVQRTLRELRTAGAVLAVKEERQTRDGKARTVYVYWTETEAQE